ncbi:MAG TPA: hypothetical protein VGV87_05520 [Blastocatellia bacterium]|jgi:hypothetical protein|nr:hypothetical protein [Blastocatellia bacterium]
MEGRTTSRNKARILVLSVFVIGAAAGALSMNLYQGRGSRKGPHSNTPVAIVDKMKGRLNLTPDQSENIGAILKDTFNQYDIIRQDADPCFQQIKPRFDAVRQASREKMRAVLTEGQLPEFEKMVRERDAEREKERENRNREHKESDK